MTRRLTDRVLGMMNRGYLVGCCSALRDPITDELQHFGSDGFLNVLPLHPPIVKACGGWNT